MLLTRNLAESTKEYRSDNVSPVIAHSITPWDRGAGRLRKLEGKLLTTCIKVVQYCSKPGSILRVAHRHHVREQRSDDIRVLHW